MSEKYKLYGHPVSPFSYLAQLTLTYKNIDFEYIYVDLASGDQRQESYLEMNPYGLVPLLVTPEGYNIYESWAIFEYLEEKFPERNLLPKSEPARAKTRSISFSVLMNIIPNARELLLDAMGYYPLSDEARQKTVQALEGKLAVFQKEFLSLTKETELTSADAIFYQVWTNMCLYLPSCKTDFPDLQNYYEKLNQNQYIKQVEANPIIQKVRGFVQSKLTQISIKL